MNFILKHDALDRLETFCLTFEHFVSFKVDLFFHEWSIGLLLLHNALVYVLKVLPRKVLDALFVDQVGLDACRIGNHVQEALHVVILLLLDIADGFVVWSRQSLRSEVAPLELQVNVKRYQAAPAELIIREEFRELEEVVIHNFVSNLIVVLDVNTTILEYTILHLDVVQETVFWIEPMEEWIFIDYGLPLPGNISVVLGSRTLLSQANDALA